MISEKFDKYQKVFESKERAGYVRQMFSKIAPRYDMLNRIMSLGRDLSWRKLAIREADFPENSLILDLGAGTADMALEVFRAHDSATVIGYDNCDDLIRIGQHKVPDKSMKWIIGDGRKLPFPSATFDGIVAGFSVRNIPEPDFVFREMYRILKPDGKIVILDMVKPEGNLFKKIFRFHFTCIVPVLGKLIGSDPDAYSYLLPSIENFYTSKELHYQLINIGCKQVRSQDLMLKTVSLCIGTK